MDPISQPELPLGRGTAATDFSAPPFADCFVGPAAAGTTRRRSELPGGTSQRPPPAAQSGGPHPQSGDFGGTLALDCPTDLD